MPPHVPPPPYCIQLYTQDVTLVLVGCLPFLGTAAWLLARSAASSNTRMQEAYTEVGRAGGPAVVLLGALAALATRCALLVAACACSISDVFNGWTPGPSTGTHH